MNAPRLWSLVLLLAIGLTGCATSSELNKLQIGMSRQEVLTLLGTPDSTSAQANVEYLTYYLESAAGNGREQPYMVRLVNGRVESFGRFLQLFDLYNRPVTSAKPGDPNFPAAGGMLSAPMAAPQPAAAPDLVAQIEKLKALHDKGALTDEEFSRAKAKLLDASGK